MENVYIEVCYYDTNNNLISNIISEESEIIGRIMSKFKNLHIHEYFILSKRKCTNNGIIVTSCIRYNIGANLPTITYQTAKEMIDKLSF